MKVPKKLFVTSWALALLAALTEIDSLAADVHQPACAKPIQAVLSIQVAAWNDGDLEQFMSHYWKSSELTFCSGGKTVRGWQVTLDRYRQNYKTRAAMGTLTFTDVRITALGSDHALVLGTWRLKKASEVVEGNFSLVFRKQGDNWVIIHDHTSTLSDES